MIATSGGWRAVFGELSVTLTGPVDGFRHPRNVTHETSEFIGDTQLHEDVIFEFIFGLAEKEIGKLPGAKYTQDGDESFIYFDVDQGGPIKFTKAQLRLLNRARANDGSLVISKEHLKAVARRLKDSGLVTIDHATAFEIKLTPAGIYVADEQGGIKHRNRYNFTKEELARL